MRIVRSFWNSESGAVTVDWVVLTSSIVGISIAVMVLITTGIQDASNGIRGGMNSIGTYDFTIKKATHYFDVGIAAHPDNQHDAWLAARIEVDADAPAGFNYDPERNETRYVENDTSLPIYVSDDGTMLSIGGEIIPVEDYDQGGTTSFIGTFNQYWDENQ